MTEADLEFPSKHQRVMKMSLLSGVLPHSTSKSFHNCPHTIPTSNSLRIPFLLRGQPKKTEQSDGRSLNKIIPKLSTSFPWSISAFYPEADTTVFVLTDNPKERFV